jgi:hypothetical protein
MTTTALNGQILGQAERATRAVLDGLLAEIGTPFLEWVGLNLLATGGPQPVDDLVEQVRTGLLEPVDHVRAAVGHLLADGLVAGSPLALTPAGAARQAAIRERIAAVTGALYADIPAEDLATAGRVLRTVTERARATLSR